MSLCCLNLIKMHIWYPYIDLYLSLLSIISKIFERVVLSRLNTIFAEKKIPPNEQFGFRAKHSTVEQAHRITAQINEALEKGEFGPTVNLDVSRAFNCVWHEELLHKLKSFLPSAYCELLSLYLHDCFFRIKVGCEYSEYAPIRAGVRKALF